MTHREIMLVLLGLAFGMFLASLDQTVVSTAMRTIADDLQGLSQQAWVTTSYLIVSTVVTPIAGKLSDIFGRRPIYIISIGIFLLGSLLSGLANSMIELAARQRREPPRSVLWRKKQSLVCPPSAEAAQ
jgi:MFS family permease